jgi:hypothetical protein
MQEVCKIGNLEASPETALVSYRSGPNATRGSWNKAVPAATNI